MKAKILLLILFFSASVVFTLQWPVDIRYMSTSFMEESSGLINTGLIFKNYDSMRPYDYGETIFRYTPEAYGALPGANDSMLVLEHENGFQSIYSRITPPEIREDRNRLSAGEFLKAPSEEDAEISCYFYIRDSRLNQMVNPLILLPVPSDTSAPRIESVLLADGEQYIELKGQADGFSVPVGNYQVYIKALDETDRGIRQMPYSYALYNLGSLLLERELDAVMLQKGEGQVFKDGVTLASVFSLPSYVSMGELILISGQSILEISVTDVRGNEGSEFFELQVVR